MASGLAVLASLELAWQRLRHVPCPTTTRPNYSLPRWYHPYAPMCVGLLVEWMQPQLCLGPAFTGPWAAGTPYTHTSARCTGCWFDARDVGVRRQHTFGAHRQQSSQISWIALSSRYNMRRRTPEVSKACLVPERLVE